MKAVLLIATAVVLIVYLMKKDEPDPTKRPNYLVLFAVAFGITYAAVALTGGSGGEDNINVVMKEIVGGEPDF